MLENFKLVSLKKMNMPVVLNVWCSHPDTCGQGYEFVLEYDDFMDWDDKDFRVEANRQIREFVENEINKYGYWHEIEMSIDFFFKEENSQLYKKYTVEIE